MIEIETQAALDKALKKEPGGAFSLVGKVAFAISLTGASVAPRIEVCAGASLDAASYAGAKIQVTAWGNSTVTARGNSTVTARGNSTVTAWGNSTVTAWENSTVTAWGNSTVTAWENSTVTAWENSTVTARGNSTVTAWENSTVTAWENSTVTARGNSTVTAWENSTVTAWGYAFVRVFSAKKVEAGEACIVALHADAEPGRAPGVNGGRQVICPPPATPEAWCNHYGVEMKDGVAIVYKAVNGSFFSPHGADYTPGKTPVAPDWDGGKAECGGGLHFSPHPEMARQFFPEATRYLACPVALKDIAVHPRGNSPQKIKARGCCGPTVEVDINGNVVPTLTPVEAP